MVIPLITFTTIKDWIEEIWLLYVVLYKAGKDCLYTRVRAKKVDGRDGIGTQLGATQA